jgi:exopolysaccharide production protein ExoQ
VSFLLASIVCYVGIAGLFYLDRDKSLKTSKALWLPVIWLWITGSRPASEWLARWFGISLGSSPQGISQQLDGSPVDAAIFLVLLVASVVVLLGRKRRAIALLKASAPVIIYFIYCLLSVLWAPYPGVAFKRWIKDIGDLAIVLVVATETDPIAALRRLFSRLSFILLPASVLLIRYSDLGRGFDVDGNSANTGVTTNKNTLGLITFILALGVLWNLWGLLRSKRGLNRKRRIVAQGAVLAFGVALLSMAHSATSVACFILGTVLILTTSLRSIGRRPSAVHALVATILLAGGLMMLFGGEGTVVHALGRKSNFTGRTELWKAVIPAVSNPIIGAGFESFWVGPDVEKVWNNLRGWYNVRALNTAHNGYIEIYINLGWVGVCLLASILINGYRRAVDAFRRDPAVGGLMLAYIATTAIYSITEAGFRMLTPTWIFLLLAVVTAGGAASGLIKSGAPQPRAARVDRIRRELAGDGPASTPQVETIEPVRYGLLRVWDS